MRYVKIGALALALILLSTVVFLIVFSIVWANPRRRIPPA